MIVKVSASMNKYANIQFRIRSRWLKPRAIKRGNFQDIPVIINNFNRLECLQQLLQWLEKAGMKKICIIDNHSTYQPLLQFYKSTKYTVFILDKNVGFLALWKSILFQRFKHSYYIYTDPDIIPAYECPVNAVEYFFDLLQRYPSYDKVGFGLIINDLPGHYPLKEKVINWEKKFWQKELEPDVYEAPIDTTFALYRPGVKGGSELKAIRTGGDYTARHLSWYINPAKLSKEENYYMKYASSQSSWTAELLGGERNINY